MAAECVVRSNKINISTAYVEEGDEDIMDGPGHRDVTETSHRRQGTTSNHI